MCCVATLGGFLRNELNRRDWSPEEFARRCVPPVSTTLVYQIMNGQDNVRRSTFGGIAWALGMTPAELHVAIGDGPPGEDPRRVALQALLRQASDETLNEIESFARWKVQPTQQRRSSGRRDASSSRDKAKRREIEQPTEPHANSGGGESVAPCYSFPRGLLRTSPRPLASPAGA